VVGGDYASEVTGGEKGLTGGAHLPEGEGARASGAVWAGIGPAERGRGIFLFLFVFSFLFP
jgi:hypothetical protein